jgi:hypothetical protein
MGYNASMFSNASKRARSGTPHYPTPRLLVEHMVSELVNSRRRGWVTFETRAMKHFVEVAYDEDDALEVNVAYRFAEHYRALFARQKVTIPDGWRVREFKQKGWFLPGTLILATGVGDAVRIAHFVDCVFLSIYGERKDYQLSGDYRG